MRIWKFGIPLLLTAIVTVVLAGTTQFAVDPMPEPSLYKASDYLGMTVDAFTSIWGEEYTYSETPSFDGRLGVGYRDNRSQAICYFYPEEDIESSIIDTVVISGATIPVCTVFDGTERMKKVKTKMNYEYLFGNVELPGHPKIWSHLVRVSEENVTLVYVNGRMEEAEDLTIIVTRDEKPTWFETIETQG